MQHRLVTLVLATFVLMIPSAALAQFGGFGGADPEENLRQLRRNFEEYGDLLGLDDEQREAGLALVDLNLDEMRAMMDDLQARIEEMTSGFNDPSRFEEDPMAAMQAMREQMRTMREEMTSVVTEAVDGFLEKDEAMLTDLRLLLREDQVDAWPMVERRHRRKSTLNPQGAMTHGAGVDLVDILEEIDAPTDGPVREIATQYELEIDTAVKKRTRQMVGMIGDMMDYQFAMSENMMGGSNELPENPYIAMRESGLKLRDMNRRYARQLESAMSDDTRTAFHAEWMRRHYPEVYSPTGTDARITTASKLGDLSADQRERLEAVRTTYTRDVAALNDKYAKAIAEQEEDPASADPMQMAMMMQGMGDGNDPVSEARAARNEFEQRIVDQIDAVLNEEQLARMPDRPSFDAMNWFQVIQEAQAEAAAAEEQPE